VNRPRTRQAVDALSTELGLAGLLRSPGRWRTARALLALVPVTLAAGLAAITLRGDAAPLPYALAATTAVAAVLLWRIPRTTAEARRALAAERARHPLPAHRRAATGETGTAERIQLYVALYGDAALALFYPHFARDGGLLGQGRGNPDDGLPWRRVHGIPALHLRAYREPGEGGDHAAGCGGGGGD
jgi:hypothetical protein